MRLLTLFKFLEYIAIFWFQQAIILSGFRPSVCCRSNASSVFRAFVVYSVFSCIFINQWEPGQCFIYQFRSQCLRYINQGQVEAYMACSGVSAGVQIRFRSLFPKCLLLYLLPNTLSFSSLLFSILQPEICDSSYSIRHS